MSTTIMSACWKLQGMTASQKSVLISLADQANDDGVCWPSVGSISKRTCLSERAVQNAIKWLAESGLLSIHHRQGRSTIYTVTPAEYAPPQEVRPAKDAPPPPHHMHPTPAPDAPITINEPSVEPPIRKKVAREKTSFCWLTGKIVGLHDAVIDKWQEAYPAIDVRAEITKAEAWQLANPKNRKSDYTRFLNGWLSRAQDRAPRVGAARAGRPSINDFSDGDDPFAGMRTSL